MSPTALELAYRRYFPVVRANCDRLLRDREEAQDVAQETFIRLWKSGLAGRGDGEVTAWIHRIATRLSLDRLRRRKVRAAAGASGPGTDGGAQQGQLDSRRALEELARTVPGDELEVAVLHRMEGLEQQEIAEVLQVSARTVRRMLARLDGRLLALQRSEP